MLEKLMGIFRRGKRERIEYVQSGGDVAQTSPAATLAQNQRPTVAAELRPDLVAAIRRLPRQKISDGLRLYHGCSVEGRYEDPVKMKLLGSRKWLSECATYASEYAYYVDGNKHPSFWSCDLAEEAIGVLGSQYALIKSTSWARSEFPPMLLPDLFEAHAREALQTDKPVILLDHPYTENGKQLFKEVLVSRPETMLRVLEVIQLPIPISGQEWGDAKESAMAQIFKAYQ